MGNRCCTDRKPTTRENNQLRAWGDNLGTALARDASNGAHGKSNGTHNRPSKSIVAFDNQKQTRSTGFQAKSQDADKFDRAFEANDIAGLVALLLSRQPIQGVEDRMHPWAQDPQTVGALAGTQLSALAQIAVEEDDPQMRISIGEAGAIVPLVDFLRSGEENRVQTAVVALSHLLTDCPSNVKSAYEAGVMELLLEQLEAPVVGMRCAAANALRDIFVENDAYRRRFVQLGGVTAMVKQLSGMPDSEQWTTNHQYEALVNLQDLLDDDSGNVIQDYAREAMTAGAEEHLRVTMQTDDEEVRKAASEMLHSLRTVTR